MNTSLRHIVDLDWMTLVLFLSLVLLALGKYFFKNFFFTFLILPFNTKYMTLNKKKGRLFHGFHSIACFLQLLNIALFLSIITTRFYKVDLIGQNELFAFFGIGLLLFLVIKIILQLGNGYFFENHALMNELIFEKATYFNYGGLIVFLGNILLIYVLPDYKPLIYFIILLFLIINGIGIIKMLKNYQKLILGNTFYFILYLCTLEISPIAIIISYLNS